MSIVNWAFLQYPYPIGYNIPAQAIAGMLPVIALFNATLVFYTVPIGYAISKAVGLSTRALSPSPPHA